VDAVMHQHIALVFGTRPEAIKLFPVIYALRELTSLRISVLVTGQHRAMLDQVLAIADIKPDIDLNIMLPNQTLDGLTARLLLGIGEAFDADRPDSVIVQGDTTSAMVASLAAFYRKIPVAHVEAGLRTGNNYSPWPEEINRRIISPIASLHFAPTKLAAENLTRENVDPIGIHITGNTGIDALLLTKRRIDDLGALTCGVRNIIAPFHTQRIVLVTAHRRENFDVGLANIARAIKTLSMRDDVVIVFPVHPNPQVRKVINATLKGSNNIVLLDPLEYVPFVYLMSVATLILTDSGGIQEEAPSLGKPVLVLRDTTERPEGIEAGTARLVGTNAKDIVSETERLLDDQYHYEKMSRAANPYGDGRASERIASVINDQ
jgi:UDP-N-acetylglucosamine 2-epimerase (non-hydrolysing)